MTCISSKGLFKTTALLWLFGCQQPSTTTGPSGQTGSQPAGADERAIAAKGNYDGYISVPTNSFYDPAADMDSEIKGSLLVKGKDLEYKLFVTSQPKGYVTFSNGLDTYDVNAQSGTSKYDFKLKIQKGVPDLKIVTISAYDKSDHDDPKKKHKIRPNRVRFFGKYPRGAGLGPVTVGIGSVSMPSPIFINDLTTGTLYGGSGPVTLTVLDPGVAKFIEGEPEVEKTSVTRSAGQTFIMKGKGAGSATIVVEPADSGPWNIDVPALEVFAD